MPLRGYSYTRTSRSDLGLDIEGPVTSLGVPDRTSDNIEGRSRSLSPSGNWHRELLTAGYYEVELEDCSARSAAAARGPVSQPRSRAKRRSWSDRFQDTIKSRLQELYESEWNMG